MKKMLTAFVIVCSGLNASVTEREIKLEASNTPPFFHRDKDGDGVPDHLDHCPNTPYGKKVWNEKDVPTVQIHPTWVGCAGEGDTAALSYQLPSKTTDTFYNRTLGMFDKGTLPDDSDLESGSFPEGEGYAPGKPNSPWKLRQLFAERGNDILGKIRYTNTFCFYAEDGQPYPKESAVADVENEVKAGILGPLKKAPNGREYYFFVRSANGVKKCVEWGYLPPKKLNTKLPPIPGDVIPRNLPKDCLRYEMVYGIGCTRIRKVSFPDGRAFLVFNANSTPKYEFASGNFVNTLEASDCIGSDEYFAGYFPLK